MVKFVLPASVVAIVGWFFWSGIHMDSQLLPSVLIDQPFPEFNLTTVAHPEKKLDLTSFKGQVVLVNIWATWCFACKAEHNTLMDITQAQAVPIIGVNYKDQRQASRQWLEKLGDPYIFSLFDEEGLLGMDLGVSAAPESFIVDKKGVIRFKHIGIIDNKVWQQQLQPLIDQLKEEV